MLFSANSTARQFTALSASDNDESDRPRRKKKSTAESGTTAYPFNPQADVRFLITRARARAPIVIIANLSGLTSSSSSCLIA